MIAVALLLVTVLAPAVDASAGVNAFDHRKHLSTLRVAAVYNDKEVQIRFEFPTDQPSWYHQYWVYEDGTWVRCGDASERPDPHGLYEDRISMMLDDGSVPHFANAGGFVTVHPGMRSLDSAASPEEVAEHPYLGGVLGRDDVRKFISPSREGFPGRDSWKRVRSKSRLDALRADGVFLDLWQWRAHRSHPVGYADNGYVLEYRHASEGRSMYTTNWDADAGQPAWMADPENTGHRALRIEKLKAQAYGQDDPYYLTEASAVPFDPERAWRNGDAIPHQLLRKPSGSRGAIQASGGYSEGAWRVSLTRSLDAPNPHDSKSLRPGERYSVAFAVHTRGAGNRFHHVSIPHSLGLGVGADITAQYVESGSLDDAEAEWIELTLFYPGQVTWNWLLSDHPGSYLVETDAMHISIHTIEHLRQSILEHEAEIRAAAETSERERDE